MTISVRILAVLRRRPASRALVSSANSAAAHLTHIAVPVAHVAAAWRRRRADKGAGSGTDQAASNRAPGRAAGRGTDRGAGNATDHRASQGAILLHRLAARERESR